MNRGYVIFISFMTGFLMSQGIMAICSLLEKIV